MKIEKSRQFFFFSTFFTKKNQTFVFPEKSFNSSIQHTTPKKVVCAQFHATIYNYWGKFMLF